MKIRITKKGLPKAQTGLTQPGVQMNMSVQPNYNWMTFGQGMPTNPMPGVPFPTISLPNMMVPDSAAIPQEALRQQAPQPYNAATALGINYTGDASDRQLQDRYDGDKAFQKQYDDSVGAAMIKGLKPFDSRKDMKGYVDFYNKKYKTDYKLPFLTPDRVKLANKVSGIGNGLLAASSVVQYYDNKNKAKNWQRAFKQNLYDQSVTGEDEGNYQTNTGVLQPNMLPSPNEGMFAMYGGTMLKDTDMKIRITAGPKMAYGGQSGYGLDIGQRKVYTDMQDTKSEDVSSTISGVPRYAANIEAEGGETVYGDLDGDGANEHMKISGPRHSQGGVPLNVPEGSFIYSDTKKMKIKDPEILKAFGVSYKGGGVTPASIAKKYDINKYKAVLEDPSTDDLSKSTAQMMVKNYQDKLARLAMIQEGMKGFPQGVPAVSQGLMEASQGMTEMAYGGNIPLPKAQFGPPMFRNFWETEAGQPLPFMYGPGPGINPSTGKVNTARTATPAAGNPSEEEIFNEQMIAELKKKGYDIKYSPRIGKGDTKVPLKQGKQKTGLYGDVNMAEIAELKARHPWYFANKPNWNPSNPEDVYDFQKSYDNEFAQQKGYSYFDGSKPFAKKDKKLGEYTYNAPGLDMGQPEVPTTVVNKPQPENPRIETRKVDPNPNTFTGNQRMPFGYMTPDIVNMFAASAVPPSVTFGFRPKANFEPGKYVLEDWLAKAQQRQQAYNIAAQTMGTYGPASGQAANLSFLAGQAGDAAAGDISAVDSRNVDRANVALATERQRKDQNNLFNLAQSQELWKDNAIAKQQFDNARRSYLNNIAKSFDVAWNNRMNLGLVNAVNPMYNIDPRSGRSYFKKGFDPSKLGMMSAGMNPGSEDYWSRLNEGFMAARGQFPDLTSQQYLSAMRVLNSSTDRNGDGVPDSFTSKTQMPFGGYVTYPF